MDGNHVHEGGEGLTLNGKFHFEFPFCFSEPFPKNVLALFQEPIKTKFF